MGGLFSSDDRRLLCRFSDSVYSRHPFTSLSPAAFFTITRRPALLARFPFPHPRALAPIRAPPKRVYHAWLVEQSNAQQGKYCHYRHFLICIRLPRTLPSWRLCGQFNSASLCSSLYPLNFNIFYVFRALILTFYLIKLIIFLAVKNS